MSLPAWARTALSAAPDIYLLAAEKAGCAPKDCAVVEDALGGLAAAHAAGMPCVCVTTSFSAEVLRENGADYVCGDVGGVTEGIAFLSR
ncbi:MAG: HAD-IA family hydrolase [Oscillospiraceae bacterium]|jgi:beta-phosphoglucomutase-like phosphatase (HAD superfamily)|nr:HAD-IA family hydrolase [Oscillospiraceae bacterium]